jgi:hypothetical protein
VGNVVQEPRDHALADDQHDRDKSRDLGDGDQQRRDQYRPIVGAGGGVERGRQRRQHHEREDHGDVLDDQPADGDAPAIGLEQAALLQGPQQHDRARHRQRQAEDDAGPDRPAEPPRQAHPEEGRGRDLEHRTGNRDRPHRQQVREREMQADAKHQQDDADLGQFIRHALVRDVARRERPDQDAGEQIADQRRDPEAVRQCAECEGQHEADDDHADERRVMRHRRSPRSFHPA